MIAPAGYGKSTMLAEWAATDDRLVAWASVDRLDNDPAALLTLLATSLAEVSADAAEVVAEMRGVGASMLGRSAPMLGRALNRTAKPFVLFIDDLHLANSSECRDALEVVLAEVPDGSQVVIGGRVAPDFVTRLRVGGSLLEIGEERLRIEAIDARTIFEAARVDAGDEEISTVVERCEGWPTGIFLCALASAGGSDVVSVSGEDTFVSDYLYQECFTRLDPALRDFLRRTAVLSQLSGPLCDSVREADNSQAMLHALSSLNLFLIPLDRRRRWFRYHALFREFLLGELERVEAKEISLLHGRAAKWFESEGANERAIEHLLASGERQRSPALVAAAALPAYQRGEVASVERWLSELGDDTVKATPALTVIAAWTAILLGKSPASEQWAAGLEHVDVSEESAEDQIAFKSARAMVRAGMCGDGPARMLADANYAVDHEPVWSPWRDQALHLLGSAYLLNGENRQARQAFEEAIECAVPFGNTDSVLLSEAELAILAIDDGDWAAADAHAASGRRAIDANHMSGYATTALALAVSARIAIHNGDDSSATRLLAQAMRARVDCTHVLPYLAMRTRLQLAMCYSQMGDRAAAMHLLHEVDDLLRRRPRIGVLAEQIETFRAQLAETVGHFATTPLTPAELRLLPYLQTHLKVAEIGQRLFISRNTVSTEVASIYRKLNVSSRAEAVERAIQAGMLGE
ncbi:LuxR C-terminal-related transcriptional regulator [Agromyces terreus]